MTISTERWGEIFEQTKGLTQPALLKKLIPEEEVDNFRKLLMESFRGFIEANQYHLGLKVFVDRQRSSGFESSIAEYIPEPNESGEAWGKRVFKDQSFGIILNNLEKHSDDLVAVMTENVKGLLEKAGLPLNGLALLFFMGNYGFTPFGIHKETRGEEGFLIHFGPGEKTFYTFPTEDYLELSQGSEVHPVSDAFLEKGTAYKMQPGDAFFVPSNVFHVAETNEFSFSMVLDYFNLNEKALIQKLVQRIDPFNENEPILSAIPYRSTPGDSFDRLMEQGALRSLLKQPFEDHCLRLLSNGGFSEPLSKPLGIDFINNPFKVHPSFRLMYRKLPDDRLRVMARGNEYVLFEGDASVRLVETINFGREMTISTVQDLVDVGEEYTMAIQFIAFLANCGAIIQA